MRTYDSESTPTYRKVASAIAIICTALVGVLEIKNDASAGSAPNTAALRSAQDAGRQIEEYTHLSKPDLADVRFAVDGAGGRQDLRVAAATSTGATDRYEISGSDEQDVACLEVSIEEPPSDEYTPVVDVSTSATLGPC